MAKKKRAVTPKEIDELADFFEDNPIYDDDDMFEDDVPSEDRSYKKGGKVGCVARQVKGFGKARRRKNSG
jgi:hypothetical protein